MTDPTPQSNSTDNAPDQTEQSDDSLWQQGSADPQQQSRLRDSLYLESGQVPVSMLRWLQGTTAVLAGSIVVSALIPIQDYVVASGEIEPAGEIQKVQHLEGGIIREQLVSEGQRIKKGQILLKLDPGQIGSQEQETATRITNLTLEQRELRRSLGDVPMNAGKNTPTAASEEVERAFRDVQLEKSKEYQRQLALSRQRVATMQAKRREYLDEVALLKQQMKAYSSLDRSGAIAHNDVLEAQRRIAATETQLAELDGQIAEAQIAMNELRAKLRMDTYEQLAKVTGEKAQLQSVMGRQLGELERLQVRSPVDGVVKSYSVKTMGGVIAPGSVVAEVVPVGQRLEAFTRVNPKDIGNVGPPE
ncbi:MAG: HlyD family efflux transporter periplasmic adaptor subunit [Cyanobacteria bacterium K_DeepCast_35m_m2_023]|nr:HlyD family efflux transporter periplasmic adaptor subunit [Cyanobacteria bacterium K_DeepCast_35m_m2_023]